MDTRGLACETAEILTDKQGLKAVSHKIGEVNITDVSISEEGSKLAHRPSGRYITLEGEPSSVGMTALFRSALMQIIPPRGRLFAVGLGNPDVTYDSLGAVVIRSMTARKGNHYSLCAMETDVAVRTGMDSARLVRAAAREVRADCVIAFDSLSCCDPSKIGKTVQLTNSGIIPASGVGSTERMSLTRETLGIPIAAVGVPLMTMLSAVTGRSDDKAFHITTSDIDTQIKIWGEVLAGAMDMIVG